MFSIVELTGSCARALRWGRAGWLAPTLLVSAKQLRARLRIAGYFHSRWGMVLMLQVSSLGRGRAVGWRQQVSSCRNPTTSWFLRETFGYGCAGGWRTGARGVAGETWGRAGWLAPTLLVSAKQLRARLRIAGYFHSRWGMVLMLQVSSLGRGRAVGWRQQVSSCRNPTTSWFLRETFGYGCAGGWRTGARGVAGETWGRAGWLALTLLVSAK